MWIRTPHLDKSAPNQNHYSRYIFAPHIIYCLERSVVNISVGELGPLPAGAESQSNCCQDEDAAINYTWGLHRCDLSWACCGCNKAIDPAMPRIHYKYKGTWYIIKQYHAIGLCCNKDSFLRHCILSRKWSEPEMKTVVQHLKGRK